MGALLSPGEGAEEIQLRLHFLGRRLDQYRSHLIFVLAIGSGAYALVQNRGAPASALLFTLSRWNLGSLMRQTVCAAPLYSGRFSSDPRRRSEGVDGTSQKRLSSIRAYSCAALSIWISTAPILL